MDRCLFCLLSCILAAAVAPAAVAEQQTGNDHSDPPKIDSVAESLRAAQLRLLKLEGGLEIDYRIDVEQSKSEPYFIWQNGVVGGFRIRWPMLWSSLSGEMFGIEELQRDGSVINVSRHVVRQANYNFEEQVSVARDGDMVGQIANHRHAFSANTCFPFLFQSFEQVNQYYVPGHTQKTDYWLPAALENFEYTCDGFEDVNGIRCLVLHRGSLDRIWLAPDHGYVLCRRENRYAEDQPIRELLENRDLREIADGVWLPFDGSQVTNDRRGRQLMKLTLKVTDMKVGQVQEEDLMVKLDGNLQQVEDFVSGRIYTGNGSDEERFQRAASRADVRVEGRSQGGLTLILINVAVLLGVVVYLQSRKRHL